MTRPRQNLSLFLFSDDQQSVFKLYDSFIKNRLISHIILIFVRYPFRIKKITIRPMSSELVMSAMKEFWFSSRLLEVSRFCCFLRFDLALSPIIGMGYFYCQKGWFYYEEPQKTNIFFLNFVKLSRLD